MSPDAAQDIAVLTLAALFGLAIGSFLNVVIARTPRLIDAEGANFASVLRGLAWPPSHCGSCAHHLEWRDNIPVFAFVMLRGRCRFCGARFSARYLLVELAGAAIAVYAAAAFGPTGKAALLALFGMGVLALVLIDLEEQLLPDVIVAPLLALGLVFQAVYGGGLLDGLAGAALGFAVLWAIRAAYRLMSGVDGMGFGDLKFAAMLGAWVGLSAIPPALFLAFASGAVITGTLMLAGKMSRTTPAPFGPFLAAGALAVLALPGLAPAITHLAGF